MRTTTIRFSGLASGLDTESIVKGMTTSAQNKVNSSKQTKMLMDMQKAKYKEVSSMIRDFTNKWAGNARLETSFNKMTVTSPDTSKIEVKGSSVAGTHKIDEVTQLAEAAKISTTSIKVNRDTTMEALGITFTDGEETVLRVSDRKDTKGNPIYKDVRITKDTSIGDLEKGLGNAMPNTNIKFDDTAKGFFISSKSTGKSQEISIQTINIRKDSGGNTVENKNTQVLKSLGMTKGDINVIEASGKNLEMKYDGMEISAESNTVTVNGLSFTAKSLFTGGIEIQADQDKDAIFDYVKEFITEYNKVMTDLNKLIDAPKNREYKPLLDDEKKDMSEDEIKKWNEKINDSLLSSDPTLERIVQDMRGVMSSVLETSGINNLKSIGISSTSWKDKGVLTINEDKLREAINNNTSDVIGLFAGKNGAPGLADKLYDTLNKNFKSVSGTKTSLSVFNDTALDKKIEKQVKRTAELEDKLYRMEDLYYKRFTAMEKMMQQLNSQSSWLTSQMG